MGPRAERMAAIDLAMNAGAHREWVEKERKKVDRVDREWAKRGAAFANAKIAQLEAATEEAEQELSEIKRGFRRLRRDGGSGRLTARAFDREFRELSARQDRAERRLAEAAAGISGVEQILSDPVAHVDDLHARYPALQRPSF